METDNNIIATFEKERAKYKDLKYKQLKKGTDREQQTLQMLEKFKSKLSSAQLLHEYSDEEKEPEEGEFEEEGDALDAKEADISW